MEVLEIAWRFFVLFLILLAGLLLVRWFLRRLRTGGETAVREKYPDAVLMTSDVVFFGQESKGKAQGRGNGTLALTDSELYFLRWLPRAEFRVPIASIEAIEMPLSYLGKSYGKKLLKVVYRREDGQPDSIAWYVPELEALKAQIEALRGG